MRNNPEGELDPAVDVYNVAFARIIFFRFILNRQKKGVNVAAKSGKFTASEDGKGPVALRKPRKLVKERMERKVLSPVGVAAVPYSCNNMC